MINALLHYDVIMMKGRAVTKKKEIFFTLEYLLNICKIWKKYKVENFLTLRIFLKNNWIFFLNFDLNNATEHEWWIRFFTARMTVMRVGKFSKKKNEKKISTSISMMVLKMNDQYTYSLRGWPWWELQYFHKKN